MPAIGTGLGGGAAWPLGALRRILPGASPPTFEDVGREWQAKRRLEGLSPSALDKDRLLLERLAYPVIGSRRMDRLKPPEILALLRQVEARGRNETAHRLRSTISRVFHYGIATGRCEQDPAAALAGALVARRTRHHPTLFDRDQVGELLRAIRGYTGAPSVRLAMLVLLYTYVRPGELRQGRWSELDAGAGLWTLPAGRMKMRRKHIVPVSRQVSGFLAELREITGGGDLMFAAVRGGDRPISDGTINAALRRLGYGSDQVVGHGFRRTASTVLNESGLFSPDAIEMSLAHAPQGVRAIYNAAQYLPERVEMAQWYSDWLDAAAAG